jgi:hypothetical protein
VGEAGELGDVTDPRSIAKLSTDTSRTGASSGLSLLHPIEKRPRGTRTVSWEAVTPGT